MLEQIETAMTTAHAMDDPWEAVVYVMTAVAEHQSRDQLFLNSAGPELFAEERFEASTLRIFAQVTEVLERAQAAGVVRADLMPTDIPFVLASVGGGDQQVQRRSGGLRRSGPVAALPRPGARRPAARGRTPAGSRGTLDAAAHRQQEARRLSASGA